MSEFNIEGTMNATDQQHKTMCAYTQDEIRDSEKPELHVVIYVEAGQPGYAETTYTGDLAYCERVAASINERLGVTYERSLEIVSSSMGAGMVGR